MPGKGNIWKAADKWFDKHKSGPLNNLLRWIYTFFRIIPGEVKEENYWFYNITNLAYVLISLLHLSWIVVFSYYGFHQLTVLQLLSIFSYVVAVMFNRKGAHLLAMFIALLEVNLHQVIAAKALGWETGFQNFIPLIGLMPFLKYTEKWTTKLSLAVMCLAFYLYIDIYDKGSIPTLPVSAMQTSYLTVSNAVACFILVTLWGIVLSFSYNRTVADLLNKEQELFETQKAAEQADILRVLEISERDKEIFQLRNVELKNSNDEILQQKAQIELLVSEQEEIIIRRTSELALANKKLVELIQYNAHSLREPLTRIMGAMLIADDISREEFFDDLWEPMGNAVNDLDIRIKKVITLANSTVELFENGNTSTTDLPEIPPITNNR